MLSSDAGPGYDLDELRIITTTPELKACFHPLREQLLDLVLERAATVAELAAAVRRPRSTVAYHVGVLVDADLMKVVSTRRVRAVEERTYGRTAAVFYVGQIQPEQLSAIPNILVAAAAESVPAHEADRLRAIVRHARIGREHAADFWERVLDLTREFSELPRSGEETFRFVAGLYATDFPVLPDLEGDPNAPSTPASDPA